MKSSNGSLDTSWKASKSHSCELVFPQRKWKDDASRISGEHWYLQVTHLVYETGRTNDWMNECVNECWNCCVDGSFFQAGCGISKRSSDSRWSPEQNVLVAHSMSRESVTHRGMNEDVFLACCSKKTWASKFCFRERSKKLACEFLWSQR